MTIKEGEENSVKLIRNINMAKGLLQRRKTCDNFVPTNNTSNTSSLGRSFRSLGSKQNDNSREVKQTDKSSRIGNSPETGRRNISVARVAEAFHELQQKLSTKSKSNNDVNDDLTKNTNSLIKFELSKKSNHVSKKINMFNKVLKSSNNVNRDNEISNDNKKNKEDYNNKNKKQKKEINADKFTEQDSTANQTKIIINIDNDISLGMKHEISEEEMIIIRKRKAIGRSNSAMIPLRELVMTRDIANSRRSLSLSLIPEDETLSLLEAVERRLNLSKETNLCDTDL